MAKYIFTKLAIYSRYLEKKEIVLHEVNVFTDNCPDVAVEKRWVTI
jgi:hypothetical protein